MERITYLGPQGATFSELAYIELARLFGAPSLNVGEIVLAGKNQDVLPLVFNHGGYGAIAMETDAEGRVDGPVNTFIQLLRNCETSEDCPITVIGAIKMPISFALMVRPGVQKKDIRTVVAHPKALGACRNMVNCLVSDQEKIIESDSNGLAAEDVATKQKFSQAAALGPRVAADRYGLQILEEACEDSPATTTFFLLGPKSRPQVMQEVNRSLLVFRVKHEPGSLVKTLLPFSDAGLNLRQIHSLYTGKGQYDFAVEIECGKDQEEDLVRAMYGSMRHMMCYVLFGPFPVV
ncbi:MAG: prephenate dehydratase domain-containing protein [Candidatus Pacebacteria bacterium]|nr:prephenate dehydratase domain-containing protein [Candidatus Paceibacterota bacterium]